MREPNTLAFLRACRAAGYTRIYVFARHGESLTEVGAAIVGDFEPMPRPEGLRVSHNIGPRGDRGEPAIWALAKRFASSGGAMSSTAMHRVDLGSPSRVNPGDYDLTTLDLTEPFTVTGRTRSSRPNMQNIPRSPRAEPLIEEARRAIEEASR
jgi:hypothetical protein